MRKEFKTIVYDEDLQIEAYRFDGMLQPFPNHFHDYYVIGFMENGERRLSCKNQEYNIRKGDILLFNPGDNHTCIQSDDGTLDYRGFNISKEVMLRLTTEITGKSELPVFTKTVIQNVDITCYLRLLHEAVLRCSDEFDREEYLFLLLSMLISQYSQPFSCCIPDCVEEIEKSCVFMKQHFREHICLDQICNCAGLSKSTLLRAFTRTKGITPYCYLENVRIGEAKKLLEQGVTPADAALQTGFSDQSHFTNYFRNFIGLTPAAYREIFSNKQKENTHE